MTAVEKLELVERLRAEPALDAGDGPFVEIWEADRDALVAHLTALTEEVSRLRAEREWQPIETAPKDGSHFLASHWSGCRCDWVHDARFNGHSYMSGMVGLIATHWRPLPDPPAALSQGGEGG